MPIIRTAKTANYSQTCNDLAATPMKFKAKDLLIYLLSKPENWKVIKSAICKTLELSPYIVKKSLAWLRKHGYAIYQHCHTGYGQWFIYDKPQPKNATAPVITPKVAKPALEIPPTLLKNKETEILKEQQLEPLPVIKSQKPVVVSLEEKEDLIYPGKLNQDQKKACKGIIKKAPVSLQQDILFELAYRMTIANLNSVPGFLNTLVTAAKNGTFTRTGVNGATKTENPAIAKTEELMSAYTQLKPSAPAVSKSYITAIKAGLRMA